MKDTRQRDLETHAVHAWRAINYETGGVTPSIVLTTTFERDPQGDLVNDYVYTRDGNPNRHALETSINTLENGGNAFVFASGMAAANAIAQSLSAGDHVILSDDVYHGVRNLMDRIMTRWNIDVDIIDLQDEVLFKETLRPNTKLVWAETPSNPQLKIVDIEMVSEMAHSVGALCVVDNTWSTPIIQKPFDFGADIIMYSTTKYYGGHSDALGGALVLREGLDNEVVEKIHDVQYLAGSVPAPFDCWLILRSISTMPLRVRQQSENAMQLAQFLSDNPRVERVLYPGLEDHPNHAVAAKQMTGGFGGMLSFLVNGDVNDTTKVAGRTQLIRQATSLGGVESLIEHRYLVDKDNDILPKNLIRLSVGIESVTDLRADLEQALAF